MLKSIIDFIDQDRPLSAEDIKEFENRGETSIDQSLQYSRDFENSPNARGKLITIDKNKLENAPQVESFEVLHQPTPVRPLRAQEYLKGDLE